MGKSATNIAVVLGLLTVAFGGYYLYTQQSANSVGFEASEVTMQNMLVNTRMFIEHRQELDKLQVDISFFEDDRFLSLKDFTPDVEKRNIGRTDPFAEVSQVETNN